MSFILINCGGGGGGDSSGEGPIPDDETGNQTNQALSGHLVPESDGNDLYILDVSTGLGVQVPNTNWESQTDTFPNGNFYKTPVDYDNSQFVLSGRGCRYYSLSVDISCIAFQDYDGNYLGFFDLFYDVYIVRMSPDKAHVALFRNVNPGYPDSEYLEIYNLRGELISDKLLSERSFQWHPTNGRLIYPKNNREIYFTKPYSTESDYFLTLPSNGIDDWIYDFSVSPDGLQIVLIMATDVTKFTSAQAKAYIMNIDGTNIRKLADVPENREGYISDPTWSPDGNWILFREGYAAGQDSNTLGTLGYYYIVPVEDKGEPYILSIIPGERSQEVIQFKRDIDPYNNNDQRLVDYALSDKLKWIP
ncbi:MAG: hypothetical protein MI866_14240 [Bacteroidales bacterium]|nr:hypothetical protein [Bacteroidales bacterium]